MHKTRDSGQSLKAKANIILTPLLNHPPSDPTTMLSAIIEVLVITQEFI